MGIVPVLQRTLKNYRGGGWCSAAGHLQLKNVNKAKTKHKPLVIRKKFQWCKKRDKETDGVDLGMQGVYNGSD